MLRRKRYLTDIERVAHKAYWKRRVTRHLLALALTWLSIVLVYAVSIRIALGLLPYDVETYHRDRGLLLEYTRQAGIDVRVRR